MSLIELTHLRIVLGVVFIEVTILPGSPLAIASAWLGAARAGKRFFLELFVLLLVIRLSCGQLRLSILFLGGLRYFSFSLFNRCFSQDWLCCFLFQFNLFLFVCYFDL